MDGLGPGTGAELVGESPVPYLLGGGHGMERIEDYCAREKVHPSQLRNLSARKG